MSESERKLREQIAEEIKRDLKDAIENCICLGRDAYGEYTDKMVQMLTNNIRNGKN